MSTTNWIRTQISRRATLTHLVAGATALISVGCGDPSPAQDDAYSPWLFPPDEQRPEYLAVAAAILAASPHNTQPWLFEVSATKIEVYADLERSLGTMDGYHREMWIGLGCAIENLLITARANGRETSLELMPDPANETHVASIALSPGTPAAAAELYETIPLRHTNRGLYVDTMPEGLEALLRAELDANELSLSWFPAGEVDRLRLEDGTVAATEAIIADEDMSEDGERWYRHTREQIEHHRDGVTLDATGNSAAVRALGKLGQAPTAASSGRYWLDAVAGRQRSGAAWVILASAARYDRVQQLELGRAYQRMHLRATALGLAMQPQNQLPERQDREELLALEPNAGALLAELVEVTGHGAQMVFRVGFAWDEALPSPRRDVTEVTL